MLEKLTFGLAITGFAATAFLTTVPAAYAIPLAGTPLDLTWSVNWDAIGGKFDYSYTLTDTGGAAVLDGVRLTAGEAAVHTVTHPHGEVGFANDGGVFARDVLTPLIPAHNYDWSNLDIAANGAITIGFSDTDAPVFSQSRLHYTPTATTNLFALPVPRGGLLTPGPAIIPGPAGGGGGIKGGLGGVCAVTVLGDNKCYTYLGSTVEPVAGGFLYKKFLENTGVVAIGPDVVDPLTGKTPDNFASHFEAEHPAHVGIHHEDFTVLPDNAYAEFFGFDSIGYLDNSLAALWFLDPIFHPARIPGHNYYWSGLGNGAAGPWAVGQVLTLGFFDPHGPALTGWAGLVRGSEGTGGSDSPSTSPDNPAPVPEPASMVLLSSGLLLLSRLRRTSKAL